MPTTAKKRGLLKAKKLPRKKLASMAKKLAKTTTYQLSPFEVGQVKAHVEHGLSAAEIAKRVFKPDGKSKYGETAIQNCMNKLVANPRWKGERAVGSGAPKKTTPKQDKAVIDWLLDQRGKQKVTVAKLKKQFVYLRKLSDGAVEDRLHEAELAFLRRRKKSKVTKKYLQERVAYCQGVKRKKMETLKRWAYTDGTVFYIDRTEDELEHGKRQCLGSHVWRRSDNRDAMFQDCLGPSSYNKAQGTPVKVWGMLACGQLSIHILDEGDTMNQDLYSELIEDKFEEWCGDCEHLVCDYEKCLRCPLALHALSKTPLQLVDPYPRVSQDFNAIENVWNLLRNRLAETMPTKLESRDQFIKRLKEAVKWVNKHKAKDLWHLSTNQKKRADDCFASKPPGGRTKW